MATRNATLVRKGHGVTVTWETLNQGDEGEWVPFWEFQDRTVQLDGVFGGATVLWQGSLDEGENKTAFTLHDTQNNLLAATSDALSVVLENVLYVRPLINGGSGTTAVAAKLLGLE